MGYNRHIKKMKKIFYLLLFVAIAILTSCSGRNEPTQQKVGYIQVLNNTSDPYYVTFKGNTATSFTIQGKYSTTKAVTPGYYNIHVKQQSGYLLYPTEKDYEGYVYEGRTMIVSF